MDSIPRHRRPHHPATLHFITREQSVAGISMNVFHVFKWKNSVEK